MKDTIETRELIVLDSPEGIVRGTYHKTCDDSAGAELGPIERDRVGVLFLNSTSPTRAGNGDAAVHLADSFAEDGYPSFRIDLPGFGDSDENPPAELLDFINRGGYASIASAIVRELVARFNLPGVVIVGHCAGSVSAVFTAATSRECKGLVLIGPYFNLPKPIRQTKLRRQLNLWITRSRIGGLADKVIVRLKEIRRSIRRDVLPENANFPLLSCWKELASRGLPILILKGLDRKAADTKLRSGEFDYFQYIQRLTDRRCQITIELADGASNAFQNRLGQAAVRQHTQQWLKLCFPLTGLKNPDVSTSRREPGNREHDFENSQQCLKV
jgi:pimeloyl-ACP methyl ester carboxylesterase